MRSGLNEQVVRLCACDRRDADDWECLRVSAGTLGASCRAKRQVALDDDNFFDIGRSPARAFDDFYPVCARRGSLHVATNRLNLEHVCMSPVYSPKKILRRSP